MDRYDAIIGMAVIEGKEYPVLRCEVLVEDLETAADLLEMMGHRIFDFKRSTSRPYWHKFQIN